MVVDLNVFTNESEKVFQVIEGLGFTFDRNMALQRIKDEGMFEAWFKTLRLDVFTPSIPFSDEAAKTRVRVRFGNSEVFLLSAEALSVFKMLFNRPKDLVDLERLLLKQKGHLDVGWVERHLIETVGVDDTRVTTWRRMVASTTELP